MNRQVSYILGLPVLFLVASIGVTHANDYAIDWYSIDGGGAGVSNASTGGNYTLSGAIGQPDARNHPEPMSGGDYKLTGGFWVIPECPSHTRSTTTTTATSTRATTPSSRCARRVPRCRTAPIAVTGISTPTAMWIKKTSAFSSDVTAVRAILPTRDALIEQSKRLS